MKNTSFKLIETWYQDSTDKDLWHGENGLILNTSALEERNFYFEIDRLEASPPKLDKGLYAVAAL